jgi:hypothetical protein
VTGGFVYRGCRMPGYVGRYYYADYYGTAYSLTWDGSGVATDVRREETLDLGGTSSFGQGHDGEIYVTGHFDGVLYRIEPAVD